MGCCNSACSCGDYNGFAHTQCYNLLTIHEVTVSRMDHCLLFHLHLFIHNVRLHPFVCCAVCGAVGLLYTCVLVTRISSFLLLFFFFFVLFSFLLSHHLCWPQRHCSHATHPGIPHLWPYPGLIPRCSPAPRGPQEETSDHWWAAIRRRHCTAAKSLQWCSVMPVLIEHMQDTTYYAPCWWQC